jgi:hypothetical protein
LIDQFSKALDAREAAAADLMKAAHTLTAAVATFSQASKNVLAEIPTLAVSVGERLKAAHAAQWSENNPDHRSSGPVETNQRRHAAESAGLGARNALEHRMTQALMNGFRGGRPEEAIGVEFSTEAGHFLRPAIEIAATRAPQTAPDNGFAAIVIAQNNRLRALTKEISR